MKKTIVLLSLLIAVRAQAQDAVAVKGAIAMNLPSKSAVINENETITSNSSIDCTAILKPDKCLYPSAEGCYMVTWYSKDIKTEFRFALTIEYDRDLGYRCLFMNVTFPEQKDVLHFCHYHTTKEEVISIFIRDYFGPECGYVFK